ncbi:MAG: envelope stress response membrane protein PspC [Alphaproteobacteria bacterium]|jgi:phage shock protein C|nr:envelope stress response membrane protein PspC [Alphaproteobacteria bacterium]
MSARRTKFYLDKREAKFLGVCAGIADYTGFDPLWIRVATVLGTVFGGGFLIVAYFVIAWLAENKPYALYDEDAETKLFWQRTRAAPTRSIRDVNSSFRDIDRRLRDIETYVTTSNRGLAAEIEKLR